VEVVLVPVPSRIGQALLVESNSSQSSDPANRSRSLLFRAVQLPIQKSKSLTVEPACTVSLISPPSGRSLVDLPETLHRN